jgi:hypothetical protein
MPELRRNFAALVFRQHVVRACHAQWHQRQQGGDSELMLPLVALDFHQYSSDCHVRQK